jgi:alkylation response protein AidB-like acyl-CoA dehydrogenase
MTDQVEPLDPAERALVEARVVELFATADATDQTGFLGRQFDLGLSRVQFPVGHGGLGVTPKLQSVVDDAILARRAPVLQWTAGPGMCAPSIVTHGTDEQRRRWLRPLFAGEVVWCQLFSEPDAGSDLAGLSTQAVRDGEVWVINGQKTWTSVAHIARWGLLLARTDPNVPKHAGITAFVIDLESDGVEVRPLRQMSGSAEFNDVFLTDVVVPDDSRIGEVGDGWRVAVTTLMNERVAISSRGSRPEAGPISTTLDLWQRTPHQGPTQRQELVKLWIEAQIQGVTAIRAAQARKRGTPGPEGSTGKLFGAELNKRIANFNVMLLGPEGMLHPGYAIDQDRGASPTASFISSPSGTIAGGTSEIMRNIIGERTLGLPGDIRVDRDLPWNQVRRSSQA